MTDNTNSLPGGAGTTTGSTSSTSRHASGTSATGGTTGTSTQSAMGSQTGYGAGDLDSSRREGSYQSYDQGSEYSRTGREVVLAARQSSTPSTTMVVGAAIAGAIAGGAIPFMLSARKSSGSRVSYRSERSDLHSDGGDVGIDARSRNSDSSRR
jgi:hypothetical protein